MAVEEKEQSQEQKLQVQKDVNQRRDDLADHLLSSLDLSQPGEEKKEEKKEDKKEVKKEPEEEEESEDTEDNEDELEEEEQEEDEEDEELVPRSKIEKRIKSEIDKRKVLEAKIAELEERTSKKTDSRRDKLEAMSNSELKQLKKEARSEWRRTDDDGRANELDELLEEIDEIVQTKPKMFEDKQMKALDSKALEIQAKDEYSHIDFEKHSQDILKTAQDIYKKYPDLKNLERGQATALEMAVDHYSVILKGSKGKSKETELKREVNKMKRKTSLDSSSVKGSNDQSGRKKAYDKAKQGGLTEKVEYFTEHVLNIDKYLPKT